MIRPHTVRVNALRPGGLTQTALATLTLLLAAQASLGATFSWDAGDGFWATAGNWSPVGPPGIGDVARLGNLPGVDNTDVALSANAAVGELRITDGMTFGNKDHTFSVIGDTYLSGLNLVPIGGGGTSYRHSRIFIRPTAAPVQFSTDDLVVSDEGRVRLYEGGVVEVRNRLTIDSVSDVYGEGTIRFVDTGTVLVNNGEIAPTDAMVLDNYNDGLLDLDGTTGNGRLSLDWGGEHLTINGGSLADTFSGEILIDGDASLTMNLAAPWEADQNSTIRFGRNNNGISPEAAVLGGVAATLGGLVEVPYGTHGRVNAPVTYAETATVEVLENATFELTNDTQIDGGTFTVLEDASVYFDGPTDMRGGAFTTPSQLSSEGAVRLNGPTVWRGDVVVNGVALQNGDATVSGLTTINAGVFDMDGGGSTEWDINSALTVTADSIDSTIDNTFNGAIDVGGGVLGGLAINLTGGFDQWVMAGEMSLRYGGPFSVNRLAGSPVRITGDLEADGHVGVTADMVLASGSATTFADADTSLRVRGSTVVEAGAVFAGDGELFNHATGDLTLGDGLNASGLSVRNAGLLRVGDSPGGAIVESYEALEAALWEIEIGGHAAISEHDLLTVVGGPVLLDGLLEVLLIDIGGGLFLPEIGDEFTVLTSLNPISGLFVNNPVSFAAGQQYHWDVVYDPHTVTLVLANITDGVPEPSAAVLLLVGGSFTGIWARR